MRIFYLCPDIAEPSGGIKVLYTHVRILREKGYDAHIMHFEKGFRLSWFDTQVPIVYSSDLSLSELGSEDIIVIPEGLPLVMKQLSGLQVKKVVIYLD